MNYAELVKETAERSGMSQVEAKKVVDAVFKTIKDQVISGENVKIVDFGTFSKTERKARQGINPATKQPIQIEAKEVAKFKPFPSFLGN